MERQLLIPPSVSESHGVFYEYFAEYRQAFFHLITNQNTIAQLTKPGNDTYLGPIRYSTDPFLVGVRQYLKKILEGDGQKPYCPVVPLIEKENGYFVRKVDDAPDAVDLPQVLKDLHGIFQYLSPQKTTEGMSTDLTTVIGGFSDPKAIEKDFCDTLHTVHAEKKLSFLQKGLMIASVHPYHPLGSTSTKRADPGTAPFFRADVPLFMIRRMIRGDGQFMHTPEHTAAYESFFPTEK